MTIKTTLGAAVAALVFGVGAAQATTIFATQIDVGSNTAAGPGWDAEAQTSTPGTRFNPGDALGAPDQVGNTEGGFFSMGNGQVVVLGFGTAFGSTASIFEVTFNCSGPQTTGGSCSFQESVDVYAFNGPYTPFDNAFGLTDLTALGFTFQASVPNGLANTPGGASVSIGGPFTYLALHDTSVATGDGFDIDAVSVAPVPLPASALLLMAGLGGLGAMRRFKRAA